MSYKGTEEAVAEELQLIRTMINNYEISFTVGVAADERLQGIYGANGLPTAFLIDRSGVIRNAGSGIEEPAFQQALNDCLAEK